MVVDGNTIYADEEKVIRRIVDGFIFGKEVSLGYTYYLNGVRLETPILQKVEDFEEVVDMAPIKKREEAVKKYPILVEEYIREKYSVSDELAIQRQKDEKKSKFDEYYTFCEECKARAKKELDL